MLFTDVIDIMETTCSGLGGRYGRSVTLHIYRCTNSQGEMTAPNFNRSSRFQIWVALVSAEEAQISFFFVKQTTCENSATRGCLFVFEFMCIRYSVCEIYKTKLYVCVFSDKTGFDYLQAKTKFVKQQHHIWNEKQKQYFLVKYCTHWLC